MCYKLEHKNIQLVERRIRNMLSSTDQKIGSTDQNTNSADLISAL